MTPEQKSAWRVKAIGRQFNMPGHIARMNSIYEGIRLKEMDNFRPRRWSWSLVL